MSGYGLPKIAIDEASTAQGHQNNRWGTTRSRAKIALEIGLVLTMAYSPVAMAQLVNVVDEPYVAPAPAEVVQAKAQPEAKKIDPPEPAVSNPAPAVQLAIAPVVAPAAAPTLNYLLPGRTVGNQLQPMAIASGWQLVWEAPDFTVEEKTPLSADFVAAMTSLTESANSNGIHIKATFFRGNKLVRVTEY